MKKLLITGFTIILVISFTIPVSALENIFGGYWRTRFISQQNFSGQDGIIPNPPLPADPYPGDLQQVDTRTRFYYTAKINDNLKLVNQFEINAVWGNNTTYGDIGTDGLDFLVKDTYADFNIGQVNTKVGAQHSTYNRGFLFSDDFAGITIVTPAGPANITLAWIKAFEGGKNNNIADVDYYLFFPSFSFGDFSVTPGITYVRSNDIEQWGYPVAEDASIDAYYLSLDADFTTNTLNFWFTGIMQMGNYQTVGAPEDTEIKGWLLAAGGSVNLGVFDIHAQSFYATGDDANDAANNEISGFYSIQGQSYDWSIIMGHGIFDEQASAGSCNEYVTNIWASNIGSTVIITDKLSITGDIWYAKLAEDDVYGQNKLGTEFDLIITYQLVENLQLDLVAAYLCADDATSLDGTNTEDPYEFAAQLSLNF